MELLSEISVEIMSKGCERMRKISHNNKGNEKEVPPILRTWFIIHFIVDISVAIPLFIIPQAILSFFGWPNIDLITTRLFAAALFGIGIESFLGKDAGRETYLNMLNLKIIWSTFAILGLFISILQGANHIITWFGILVFGLFNLLWIYWKKLL